MNKFLLPFYLVAVLLTASCSKSNDPAPAPSATASFTMSTTVAEVGEPVQLTSTSQNAVRYEWRTSDAPNTVNTAPNPVAAFAAVGSYTITLTAYNSEGKSSTTTQNIKVGRRYYTELRVSQLNFFNANGAPWDSGSGPDVKFRLTYNGTILATGNTIADVTSANLPLVWNLSPLSIEAVSGSWLLTFLETNNVFGDNVMVNFPIDESIRPTTRDAQGASSKTATYNGWQVTMAYQIR